MLTRKQIQVLNKVMSDSHSEVMDIQGRDVLVFEARRGSKALEQAMIDAGFKQDIKQDKFGNWYGHCQWWNEEAQVLIGNVPGLAHWTIANEDAPLTAAEFADLH